MFDNLFQTLTGLFRTLWSAVSDLGNDQGMFGILGRLQKHIDSQTLFAGIGVFLFLVSLGLYKWRKDTARRRKLLEEFNAALEEAEGLEEPRPPISPPRKRPSATPKVTADSITNSSAPITPARDNFEEDFSSRFAEDWDALRELKHDDKAGGISPDPNTSTTMPESPEDIPPEPVTEPEEIFVSKDNIDTTLTPEQQDPSGTPSFAATRKIDEIPDSLPETDAPETPPARKVLTLEPENLIEAPDTGEPAGTSDVPPAKRQPIMLSLENLIEEPVVLPDPGAASDSPEASAELPLKAFEDLQKEVEKTIHNLGKQFKDHFVQENADAILPPEETRPWSPENARRVIQKLETLSDRLEKQFAARKPEPIEQTMLTPASSLGEQFKTRETCQDDAVPLNTLESLLFTQKSNDDQS